MTIPEYDKECDCEFCTMLRNERLQISKEKHSKNIGNVKKENMIFTPIRHVDGE
jgi:hypothetical protein